MASIVGKEYKNKSTNERIKVSSIENNIAILENDQRIALERLLDPRFYVENQYAKSNVEDNTNNNNSFNINEAINQVNNNSNDTSMNENNNLNLDTSHIHSSLLNDIKTKLGDSTDYQDDHGGGVSHRIVDPVESHGEAQRNQRESSANNSPNNPTEQELIERHRKRHEEAKKAVSSQQESLKEKYKLEDEDFVEPIKNNNFKGATHDGKPIDDNRDVSVTMKDENNQEVSNTQKVTNKAPSNPMFEKMKRVKKHTLKIEFEELLPEKDLLKMLEDGFEDSVLDYLTDEVAAKVFSNVDIKQKIKEQLKEYTYGKKRQTKPKSNKTKSNTNSKKKSSTPTKNSSTNDSKNKE